MKPPPFVARFDSSFAMVNALARFLRGRASPRVGKIMPPIGPLTWALNALPRRAADVVYSLAGRWEATSPEALADADLEDFARWVAAAYPARRYPAVAIGASSGPLVHLWAALGVPWLPQTFLVPARRDGPASPDDPRGELAWGERAARGVLHANPDLVLHHMHDPNQDRLMVRYMAYFRFKRRRVGAAWERFLLERLAPGGTVILVEGRTRWPTTRVSDRHLFQFGAVGGLQAEEYHDGSPRVQRFLAAQGAAHDRWDPPAPDGWSPEAEWGFDRSLREDVLRLARRHRWRVVRLVFDDPMDPSPAVADLHRAWHDARRLAPRPLLVESFVLLDPWWVQRAALVPFWTTFPVESALERLNAYLDVVEFDDVLLTLFSNGLASAGQPPLDAWRDVLRRARRRGALVGVDPRAYPRDFAAFYRFVPRLRALERAREDLPAPLPLRTAEERLRDAEGLRWEEVPPLLGTPHLA